MALIFSYLLAIVSVFASVYQTQAGKRNNSRLNTYEEI
jgi:hypothetical protein